MISEATKRKLEALYAAQGSYQPTSAIRQRIRTKTVIMTIGATCEGKNTVMDAAVKLHPQFGMVSTFTSRPPRDSDESGEYRYIENTDTGLEPLLAKIDRHEVVQYAINPHAHLIYGSEADDYPAEYNLADVFSSAVSSFRQLGFKQVIPATIITEPEVWLTRFEQRFPRAHPQRSARRAEAIESFTWSLAQPEGAHFWIENKDGAVEAAGRELIAIALGQSHGNPAAKYLALTSLELARTLDI